MRIARRVSQIFFLLLFFYLFINASFPYETKIPADIFLRSSPLIAVGTMLSERTFIAKLIPALILLLLTIPFGRFFCGWICPLGTIIDGSDYLLANKKRKKSKARDTLKYKNWKFFILTLILVTTLFSVQLIWIFDPITLLTRTMAASLFPIFAFFTETILGTLMDVSWLEDTMYNTYDVLHESILPIDPHFFQNGILFLVLFVGILLSGRLMPRFWCRNLCPLGALLGVFSKFRIVQRFVDESCTKCSLCQKNCKMNAIEDDYNEQSTIECIECMNCVVECPANSIKYRLKWPQHISKTDFSRRRFLESGFVGLITVGAVKTGFSSRTHKNNAIRPPGALEEARFLDRCIRCHECTKICSTTGGCLQPAVLESGWEGLWTPISVPRNGFCEYNCNLCGQVCPTGAIVNLPLKDKQKMKMGTASFDKSRCIPWYRLENCLVCEEHCPLPEKAINFEEKEIVRPNGEKAVVKFPYVKESLCIGCGICVSKCPLAGKAGIFVSIAGETRVLEDY